MTKHISDLIERQHKGKRKAGTHLDICTVLMKQCPCSSEICTKMFKGKKT